MVKIYSDYDEEPDDVFLPLPESLYSELYEIEMGSFMDDICFYQKVIPQHGTILEVGCGTARVSKALTGKEVKGIGIDISISMLERAHDKKNSYCSYACMDMRLLAFSTQFESVIIPYNTLNLLTNKTDILSCLTQCASLLKKNGKIYLQLYVPDDEVTSKTGKSFQFQMFDRVGGGRIIKEILREYVHHTKTMNIEERYRIRPMQQGMDNLDYSHSFAITSLSYNDWTTLFKQASLHVEAAYGGYDLVPFKHESTCLLVILGKDQAA